MNKLILLGRVYALESLGLGKLFHAKDPREKRKSLLMAVGFVLIAVMLVGISTTYSVAMGQMAAMLGRPELVLTVMAVAASLLSLITVIYKAGSVLFSFRDYDLQMALPIPQSTVVASRVLILYSGSLLFSCLLLVPAAVVYGLQAGPSMWYWLALIPALLALPLLPLILGLIIGGAVALLSARLGHSKIISVLLYGLVVVGVLLGSTALSFQATEMQVTELAQIGGQVASQLEAVYPPARLFTQGVAGGSAASWALLMALCVLPFLLFCALVGRFYRQLHAVFSTTTARGKYRLGQLHQSSALTALYQKEWRRFTSSTLYIFNTGMGALMLVVAAGALLFMPRAQLEGFLGIPGLGGMLTGLCPLVMAAIGGMGSVSCCSISLEGDHLWILKSLPVSTSQIFISKVLVNLTVLVPACLLGSTMAGIALRPSPVEWIFFYLTPLVFAVFTAVAGLVVNLLFPKLDWQSEVTVIKQSAASFTGVFATPLLAAAFIGLGFLLHLPMALVAIAATAAAALLCLALWLWLGTKGARIFAQL
ncbi:hypothetical protein [Neobittarella massiliensis]|uniref:hypothetical protein n=1 Tax=Neobittarella massiliensis (ex Bilen et al. 2018) TaxID=2041842 RepID=UPI000CF70976|nr:hypothetical protein [Neobittarella massiliensis]